MKLFKKKKRRQPPPRPCSAIGNSAGLCRGVLQEADHHLYDPGYQGDDSMWVALFLQFPKQKLQIW
jgi:hypothetical protein